MYNLNLAKEYNLSDLTKTNKRSDGYVDQLYGGILSLCIYQSTTVYTLNILKLHMKLYLNKTEVKKLKCRDKSSETRSNSLKDTLPGGAQTRCLLQPHRCLGELK